MKWLILVSLLITGNAFAADAKPFTRGSWQAIRTSHEYEPMVVHLWGLTCAPCLTELPHWAALRKSFPKASIVFIAADPAPMPKADVDRELEQAGLSGMENWIFSDRFVERLRFEIDPSWKGELPRTLLIDKDGKITAMPGIADLAKVRDWLAR